MERKTLFIVQSHLDGSLYVGDFGNYDFPYCGYCGDRDTLLGEFSTPLEVIKEANRLGFYYSYDYVRDLFQEGQKESMYNEKDIADEVHSVEELFGKIIKKLKDEYNTDVDKSLIYDIEELIYMAREEGASDTIDEYS